MIELVHKTLSIRKQARLLGVNRPDQVWRTDITDIPMNRGHACLVAVMDWHTLAVSS